MPGRLRFYGSPVREGLETLQSVTPSLLSSPQDLYLLIMKDESLYQDLREDTLRLHQLVETVELK